MYKFIVAQWRHMAEFDCNWGSGNGSSHVRCQSNTWNIVNSLVVKITGHGKGQLWFSYWMHFHTMPFGAFYLGLLIDTPHHVVMLTTRWNVFGMNSLFNGWSLTCGRFTEVANPILAELPSNSSTGEVNFMLTLSVKATPGVKPESKQLWSTASWNLRSCSF